MAVGRRLGKARRGSASSGKRQQAAARDSKQRQETASSGKRRQGSARLGKQRQETASSGKRRQETASSGKAVARSRTPRADRVFVGRGAAGRVEAHEEGLPRRPARRAVRARQPAGVVALALERALGAELGLAGHRAVAAQHVRAHARGVVVRRAGRPLDGAHGLEGRAVGAAPADSGGASAGAVARQDRCAAAQTAANTRKRSAGR